MGKCIVSANTQENKEVAMVTITIPRPATWYRVTGIIKNNRFPPIKDHK